MFLLLSTAFTNPERAKDDSVKTLVFSVHVVHGHSSNGAQEGSMEDVIELYGSLHGQAGVGMRLLCSDTLNPWGSSL